MTAPTAPSLPDRTGLTMAYGAEGLLRLFNEAGVLGLADVHTAAAVSRMAMIDDDDVRLALGLTVRALRMGSVCVDLTRVATTVFDESEEELDVSQLPWPEPQGWLAACEHSALVTVGSDSPGARPLRLSGGLLYLERYWQQEEIVRLQLRARAAAEPPAPDLAALATSLDRLFDGQGLGPGELDRQRFAAAVSALSWVTVLAGGPGTGKTTTVARVLALLSDQPGPVLRIALAAPTGKAAARLEEAVRSAALAIDPEDHQRIGQLSASTLHRLLGWLPASRGRFRHNAQNHLPFDVIVVDEMSMVSLTMMARLLEATRAGTRLILVGDPDQLSSVEAGAVLADITEAAGSPNLALSNSLSKLRSAAPEGLAPAPVHGVVELRHTWRYGGMISQLARAIKETEADEVMSVLRSGATDVVFTEVDGEHVHAMADLQLQVSETGRRLHHAAFAGDVPAALEALEAHRLLCAHRRGPHGLVHWSREVERWLAEAVPGYAQEGEWYVGRPLMVTSNDYELGLYNGDTGVVVSTENGPRAAFSRGGKPTLLAPVRLDAVQTMHAMTVHRAQGSQFACVSVIVPPPESPLLTRELLYTAATRATDKVHIFGSEEAIRRAVGRPANRASGLRGRLG